MNQNIKNILEYIQERTMADSNTTWKDVKFRFGTDPTLIKDGYLYRPATYPRDEVNNSSIKNYIEEGEKEFEEKFCTIYDTPVFVDSGILKETYPLLNTKNGNEIKQFISSRQISLIKMIVEMVESEPIEKAHTYASENADLYEGFERGQGSFKHTILDKLSELTDGK